MPAQVQIRSATTADAAAIARLIEQLGYPDAGAHFESRLEHMLASDRAAVLLAVRDARVLGLATVHVLSVLNRVRDVAWLTALVVDDSARRTGVGRALVAAVEEFARRSDCERLSVTTHEDRLLAREFYVRVGFDATGRRFGKTLSR